MKFDFVAKHRATWPVDVLCEALGVSRSGYRAWNGRALSARAQRDALVFPLVQQSFLASDRTYGASEAAAVTGSKRYHAYRGPERAGSAVFGNRPESKVGGRSYVRVDHGRVAVRRGRARPLFATDRRVVHVSPHDGALGHRRLTHGDLAARTHHRPVASLGSRVAIYE